MTGEVCKNPNPEPEASLTYVIVNKRECRIGHRAQPYPVNFDSDGCDGCTFWWVCQMIENNRKAMEE
jgi:hypothetical protein